jgi:hypothetical protein
MQRLSTNILQSSCQAERQFIQGNGAEEDVWLWEGRRNRRIEKAAQCGASRFVLLTECYWGVGQVTGAWVGEPEGTRPLRRPGRRWEDNIKMDLK